MLYTSGVDVEWNRYMLDVGVHKSILCSGSVSGATVHLVRRCGGGTMLRGTTAQQQLCRQMKE